VLLFFIEDTRKPGHQTKFHRLYNNKKR